MRLTTVIDLGFTESQTRPAKILVTANPKVKRSARDCELQKQHNNANHSPVTTTKQGLIISHNLGILFRAFSESIELSKERERERERDWGRACRRRRRGRCRTGSGLGGWRRGRQSRRRLGGCERRRRFGRPSRRGRGVLVWGLCNCKRKRKKENEMKE